MNSDIQRKLDGYPELARSRLIELRTLILSVIEREQFTLKEETLKWGEPSFLVEGGSAIRIDWKLKTPQQYYLYFNCQTRLVDTFRELYSDELSFQGNRAIVFNVSEPLPVTTVELCLKKAFQYQQLKNTPLLGG
ncbi:DUF1801 domain-containing protein [Vibrio sp. T187]|uniref:DUF1801 domain-containing protein n=1 Tax=Vibrio TaxID=662 RepID=UPI0010C9B4F6|nr:MULTISPECIES: DUF1801 domain-containing protein [Vibrio]MBW3696692.1 DUF1801 domain-containing protein [Vibrio sp. T187]